ncbi:MAG TPA: hypothetical protein ENL20_11160, partial [Candidatus Cloacimonetes bacterium]|nr:hypothetical protein [Candidatus Cloacimonadota bacterium]
MRKPMFIIILFMLVLFSSLSAQEPVSIRSQSCANIIEDDWDLIYDPIDLKFIEGTFFFSNLADFNSFYRENEGDWTEQNEPFLTELPLGMSFQNPFSKKLKHAFLFRIRDSKISEFANGGIGEFERKTTNYFDSNGDGLFDNQTLFSGKYKNYDISNRIGFVFNNNFIFGKNTIGLKFTCDKQKDEDDEAAEDMGIWNFGGYLQGVNWNDHGFDESTYNYLMEDEYSDFNFSEKGDFTTINENSNLRFNLAFMREFAIKGINPEFRFDLIHQQLVMGKVQINDNYSGDYTELGVPDSLNNQDLETGIITDSYEMVRDESGSSNTIGFSVRNVFDKQDQRKNDGFWEIGSSFGFGSGDYEFLEECKLNTEQTATLTDTLVVDWKQIDSEYDLIDDHGDYKISTADFFSRFNIPLNQSINFGFGGFYHRQVLERETNYIEKTEDLTEFT